MLKEISARCFVDFLLEINFDGKRIITFEASGCYIFMESKRAQSHNASSLIDALFRDHDKRNDMPQDTLMLFDLPVSSYNSGYVLTIYRISEH